MALAIFQAPANKGNGTGGISGVKKVLEESGSGILATNFRTDNRTPSRVVADVPSRAVAQQAQTLYSKLAR
jgi:hypothetical protein